MPFHLRALVSFLLAGLAVASPTAAQGVEFTSSDLPIVLLDTGGEEIPDEPKIPALMGVIDNGPGVRNHVTDPPTDYDGHIGIEIRGSSSQMFPKKQYGLETRDADGDSRNVSVLGMPEENDWILFAPYSDKSLMRNVVAYHLARQTGRYAVRTRFCEVVLNGDYVGVYVFMEKIKQDDNRVDVSGLDPDETSGDDLTGGYILQIDRGDEGAGGHWTSPHPPAYPTDGVVRYEFDDPDGDDLVPEQKAYIEGFITSFEDLMAAESYADEDEGYPSVIDVGSFVDFVVVNELARNVDGYRLSTFLHKDRDSVDPRLHAGPVWDFNLGFGNADYNDGASTSGLQIDFAFGYEPQPVPFWWPKLMHEEAFSDAFAARWAELRRGPFHPDSLSALVDGFAAEVDEAQERNFQRWPVLGTYVWPNAYVGETYADEVGYLRTWLSERAVWLDNQFSVDLSPPPAPGPALALSAPDPNPSRGDARLTVTLARETPVVVDVLDAQGRQVAQLYDGVLAAGDAHVIRLGALRLPPGVYFVRVSGGGETATRAVSVVR